MRKEGMRLVTLLVTAALLRWGVLPFLDPTYGSYERLIATIVIFGIGAVFVLRGTANVIEETTDVLSKRTRLASGLLQSIGTAFPDMVLGIVAASISLGLAHTDYSRAISFAVIAAATTFGSNIYNVGYAAWCMFRQNLANHRDVGVPLFPFIVRGRMVTPMRRHEKKPTLIEVDTAIDVFTALSMLTAVVAVSMVLFGLVHNAPVGTRGDLYQLVRPVGLIVLLLSVAILFHFRKRKREEVLVETIVEGDNYYAHTSVAFIFFHLLLAGAAILFTAESMVNAVQVFCEITGLPLVVAGVSAGIIGCLGEILVVHDLTVNPKGRIGDAIVGVGMDNIMTTFGASIVAVMGGIFLGGNALILIFVVTLALNTILIQQVSRLKLHVMRT